ncbi:ArnT family glycosyltransferase [Singulisphaera sp. PoT]|uniref:ArnT family glycosyltransferase n=1 Tax=Singulisphaera sp. PoT TaxID=3411797 RepID=UPI003BF505BB
MARLAMVAGLAALTLGIGLGRAGRLTYHEAFVAQAAREMVASGDVLVPTMGGRPWLEKPPLAVWLVALTDRVTGSSAEWQARFPSALAGVAVALGVAILAAYRFGSTVGLLAGLVQATTTWTMIRGRLAEADMLLACLITWTVLAFDRMRDEVDEASRKLWRWAFFAGIGFTSLAKGIGFGAALVLAAVALVLAWDRDREGLRDLRFIRGWLLSAGIALAWPLLVLLRHPNALSLWSLHVTDRVAARPEHFAGGPWWQYGPALLWQVLPWTPLALIGAWRSWKRALDQPRGGDRLLWAWAVGPIVLLSLATVKNGHYAIYALPPWSVWAALSLVRIGSRLLARGWPAPRIERLARFGFGTLALGCGLGFGFIAPRFDHRGQEWAFYETAGDALHETESLTLLYDDWDRKPYPTPFGPVPHDLAVRLYYLDRPASWRIGVDALLEQPPVRGGASFAVIGRDRDIPSLLQLGHVDTILRGPKLRARASRVDDRAFALYRVTPRVEVSARSW